MLWLNGSSTTAVKNLKLNAAALGIDPARIVFASPEHMADRTACFAHADLYLDTMPSSSAAVVNDALAAGIPVITCAGETLVSRISGSQLRAFGLSDLITYAPNHYQQLAKGLERDRKMLRGLKARLTEWRPHAGLFDRQTYQRNFETALETIAMLQRQGKQPQAFTLTPTSQPTARSKTRLRISEPEFSKPADGENLAAVDSGLKGRIPYAACPICSGSNFAHFKSADCSDHPVFSPALASVIPWCRCITCNHAFTQGYHSRDSHRLIRYQILPHEVVGQIDDAGLGAAEKIVSEVSKSQPDGDWLDAGCGHASMLMAARQAGYDCFGADSREANAERLKQRGFETWPCEIGDLDMDGRFSVVSLNDLLVRSNAPLETLNAASRLLKPGGALVVSIANPASASWRLRDQNGEHPFWSDPNHYHLFDTDSFPDLLRTHGFEPVFNGTNENFGSMMIIIATRSEDRKSE